MGDGVLLEFPSIVAAVECAIAIQKMMAERNADTPEDKRILYRIGVNLGDVLIEEARRHHRRRRQYRREARGHLRARRDLSFGGRPTITCAAGSTRDFADLGPKAAQEHRRAGAGLFAQVGQPAQAQARAGPGARKIRAAAPLDRRPALRQYRRRPGAGAFRRRGHREPDDRSLAHTRRRS